MGDFPWRKWALIGHSDARAWLGWFLRTFSTLDLFREPSVLETYFEVINYRSVFFSEGAGKGRQISRYRIRQITQREGKTARLSTNGTVLEQN
ncbi:hypothetical protein BaRGS_00031305 [Batillaria attramentaria]|uniref:Uncharacterized protein n=1 Tax=Batillaria attramentaria TaxID=370345 RepID=A0ABD0JRV7_9CAEN